MGEPFDGLAEALPLSGYTVPDAAAYLTRPTLDLLTGYDWTPTEASGTIYYTELHFAADGTPYLGHGLRQPNSVLSIGPPRRRPLRKDAVTVRRAACPHPAAQTK